MRRLLILIVTILLLARPVSAMEITAPTVPESGKEFLREEPETFAQGLWSLLKEAVAYFEPALAEAAVVCFRILAIAILVSITKMLSGSSENTVEFIGVVVVAITLIQPTDILIHEAADTIQDMSDYGKLLLPVMTTALAAHGGISSSTALYTGTVVFDAILGSLITRFLLPGTYMYICLAVAHSALGEQMTSKLKDFAKWSITWLLKIILYIFTGFMSITGVVSGTVDAAALKATKLTISGAVPVVGGILSDASEAVLVSAGLLKNTAGIYGLLAIMAVWIGPFLKIGVQYVLLKITSGLCSSLGVQKLSSLVKDYSGAMGLILAMTGTICLLLMVSVVCFMRGGYT